MKPKVSIIIPVYNVEQYLEQCLNSVCSQTLNDIEIICVNDGSTDNSSAILQQFAQKDRRILIVNKENGGLSSARNEGLKYVNASYIGFVDSDDWIEPETYETALKKIEKDNTIDVVCWGGQVVCDGIEEEATEVLSAKAHHHIRIKGKKKITPELILNTSHPVWIKLFKKSIIDTYNISFVSIKGEDRIFLSEYFSEAKFAYYLDKCFYKYRQRSNSIMWNYGKENKSCECLSLKSFKIILEQLINRGKLKKFSTYLRKLLNFSIAQDLFTNRKECESEILSYANEISSTENFRKLGGNIIKDLQNKDYKYLPCLNTEWLNKGNKLLGLSGIRNRLVVKILGIKIKLVIREY